VGITCNRNSCRYNKRAARGKVRYKARVPFSFVHYSEQKDFSSSAVENKELRGKDNDTLEHSRCKCKMHRSYCTQSLQLLIFSHFGNAQCVSFHPSKSCPPHNIAVNSSAFDERNSNGTENNAGALNTTHEKLELKKSKCSETNCEVTFEKSFI